MEHYRKSQKYDESLEICLLGLEDTTTALVVTPGTQIRSVLSSAISCLRKDGQILWIGSGSGADKAVACAEATKSRYKKLNQVTQITYKRVVEYWEPTIEGMNTLQVIKEVPAIAILLTLPKSDDHLNSSEMQIKYGERLFCHTNDS